MITMFALGTVWFWLLILTSVISIIALVENEKNAWADFIFIFVIIILYKIVKII